MSFYGKLKERMNLMNPLNSSRIHPTLQDSVRENYAAEQHFTNINTLPPVNTNELDDLSQITYNGDNHRVAIPYWEKEWHEYVRGLPPHRWKSHDRIMAEVRDMVRRA